MCKARKYLAILLAVLMGVSAMTVAIADGVEEHSETIASEPTSLEEPANKEDVLPNGEAFVAPPEQSDTEKPAPDASEAQQNGEVDASGQDEVTDAPKEPETDEPTEAPEADAPTAPAFSARVRVEIKELGDVYYGDRVTLRAVVEDANAEYTVRLEYYDEAESDAKHTEVWVTLAEESEYAFTVTEANASLIYRAVVNDVIVSRWFKLRDVQERPVENDDEPEAEEPAESDDPEVETTEEPEGELPEEPVTDPEDAPSADIETDRKSDDTSGETTGVELDPNRHVDIHAEWEGDVLYFGAESTLVAELHGYDNVEYTIQWQTSKDDENWVDVDGATELRYTMTITEENYLDYWRVLITVKDVMVAEEAAEGV